MRIVYEIDPLMGAFLIVISATSLTLIVGLLFGWFDRLVVGVGLLLASLLNTSLRSACRVSG